MQIYKELKAKNPKMMTAGERLDFGVVTIILLCLDNFAGGAEVETLVQSSGGSLRARSQFNGVSALGEKKESKLLASLEARKRCMHLQPDCHTRVRRASSCRPW
jgi:hypothetical protein